MTLIEHFRAVDGLEGPCVVSDADEPGTEMALCGRQQDAEEIASALNHWRGAVEALESIRDRLRPFVQGGEPAAEDACDIFEIADHALNHLGGQYDEAAPQRGHHG